eukprot:m.231599 g.231599  ORF g.231599 m.231599 type:complete len:506 (-) comp18415_c0_seq1:176-1693(-)
MAAQPEDILQILESRGSINSLELASLLKAPHQEIIGAIKSLQSQDQIIESRDEVQEGFVLTEEGKLVVEHGSYEARVANLVPVGGIGQKELQSLPGFTALGEGGSIGFSQAIKNKWIQPGRDAAGAVQIKKLATAIVDKTQHDLSALAGLAGPAIAEYTKRKLVVKQVLKTVTISKGANFTTTVVKPDTALTPEMLADGSWKLRTFKKANLDALGAPPEFGALHPLLKVRAEYREIFLQLGFEEMPTNQFVESSFWNFDSLFQPQQHPCRDMHDTFFLTDPVSARLEVFDGQPLDQAYVERVKTVHSTGGFGSQGYGYDWQVSEAKKNILRTHTTAISSQMLYRLSQECQGKEFRPIKLFSIDRVFRNETLDATHLAEFHQIEGVIADYNLTLGDLMGVLGAFFEKLGMGSNLRFKPAFNPYTEPSMEVFSFHPGLGRLVEVGNSGVFRPEMLLPMGIPKDVVVIAWGLSLERPTMIKYGYDNIRDLVGPKVDLEMERANPLCRI